MKMIAVNFRQIVIYITLTSYIVGHCTKDRPYQALWIVNLVSIFTFALTHWYGECHD
ncbi:protein of unknown function [Enterobacter cancerogenus]|nr:protein of unknown function [Enterobacter cancerogenus]